MLLVFTNLLFPVQHYVTGLHKPDAVFTARYELNL